jgi:hypothetical protein
LHKPELSQIPTVYGLSDAYSGRGNSEGKLVYAAYDNVDPIVCQYLMGERLTVYCQDGSFWQLFQMWCVDQTRHHHLLPICCHHRSCVILARSPAVRQQFSRTY